MTGDYLPFVTKGVDFLPNLGSHRLDAGNDDAFYGFANDEVLVRVVPGPQEDLFTEEGIEAFYSQTYTTTATCDRMGYRLDEMCIRDRSCRCPTRPCPGLRVSAISWWAWGWCCS